MLCCYCIQTHMKLQSEFSREFFKTIFASLPPLASAARCCRQPPHLPRYAPARVKTPAQTGVVDDDAGSGDVAAQSVHATESVRAEAKSTKVRPTLLVHICSCMSTFNRWRTVVSATWKYDDPRLNMSHESAARVWHLQPTEVLFPCPTNYRVSYVLSYDQPLA